MRILTAAVQSQPKKPRQPTPEERCGHIRTPTVIVVFVAGIVLINLAMLDYQRSLRRCSVRDGRAELRRAYTNYLATGKIEPNGSLKPFLFTNVVEIGGTRFQFAVGMAMPRFEQDGVLVMSTNQQFFFLGRNREPFMIPSSGPYSGPFFHRGF